MELLCGIFTEAWSGTKATFMIDPTLHVYCLHDINELCRLRTVRLTFVVNWDQPYSCEFPNPFQCKACIFDSKSIQNTSKKHIKYLPNHERHGSLFLIKYKHYWKHKILVSYCEGECYREGESYSIKHESDQPSIMKDRT